MSAVLWHDVECASYRADLPVWLGLAEREAGPVLDVGAGTGRVAIALADAGHEVVALDTEPELLAELRRRHPGVETLAGDAQALGFAGRFGLVIVPMQTIQLLGDRAAFVAGARRALKRGGLLAVAIADELAPFEPEIDLLPEPDIAEAGGWRYESQPLAVRVGERAATIERVRVARAPDGTLTSEPNAIELALLTAPQLAQELRAAGFTPLPGRRIAPTTDHVGTSVVIARA